MTITRLASALPDERWPPDQLFFCVDLPRSYIPLPPCQFSSSSEFSPEQVHVISIQPTWLQEGAPIKEHYAGSGEAYADSCYQSTTKCFRGCMVGIIGCAKCPAMTCCQHVAKKVNTYCDLFRVCLLCACCLPRIICSS